MSALGGPSQCKPGQALEALTVQDPLLAAQIHTYLIYHEYFVSLVRPLEQATRSRRHDHVPLAYLGPRVSPRSLRDIVPPGLLAMCRRKKAQSKGYRRLVSNRTKTLIFHSMNNT